MGEAASTSADGDDGGDGSAEESTGTVLLALGANLGIAVAKLVGGLVSGSAAMLAEAAHSVADTLNQVLLLTGLSRSKRPADEDHPFGYGQERYFWSLLAAVGIFVLGAGYSIYEGVHAILEPEELGGLLVPYAVLAAAFVLEGSSWLKAVRQLKREAARAAAGRARAAAALGRPDGEDRRLRGLCRPDRDRAGRGGHRAARADGRGLLGRCGLDRDRRAAGGHRLRARQAEHARTGRALGAGAAAQQHPADHRRLRRRRLGGRGTHPPARARATSSSRHASTSTTRPAAATSRTSPARWSGG